MNQVFRIFKMADDNKRESSSIIASNCDDLLHIIRPHLYLGNRENAESVHLLSIYNIRRILTVDTEPLEVTDLALRTKFVRCLDEPEADLLSSFDECIEFISCGVAAEENVIVHW